MTTIPAIQLPPPRGPVRTSRRAKWRAVVLIAVHVAIVLHVVHWLVTGSTLTPIEPSEAMQTLEQGAVNAGFVFFVLAILATLILGRWFCGWACHLVAYQDLAAWLLGKIGLRPKPVRSRILMWIPLGLAIYMFVWPQIMRWFAGRPHPGLHPEFTTIHFWETFAGPGMAITTLFVCGALIVWWFGAKGFCSYGCPYGGFFSVVDRFAPGRIRVTDACRGCRHCTATCTSNVVVHEEVLEYGMVVDPGCMKCTDCVDVCPKGALYYGFGRPSLGMVKRAVGGALDAGDLLLFGVVLAGAWAWIAHNANVPTWFVVAASVLLALIATLTGRGAKRFDFTRGEELAMLVVFVLSSQWAFRKLYGLVPHLLAIGLGAITALLVIVLWRTVRRRDVAFQHLRLRSDGKLSPAGATFVLLAALWLAFTVHSGFVQHQVRRTIALVGEAAQRPQTERAPYLTASLDHIARYDRWSLRDSHLVRYQAANIAYNQGRIGDAVRDLRKAIELEPKDGPSWHMLAEVLAFAGRRDESAGVLEKWLERHPDDQLARDRLRLLGR